jgi:hypothetical protein
MRDDFMLCLYTVKRDYIAYGGWEKVRLDWEVGEVLVCTK